MVSRLISEGIQALPLGGAAKKTPLALAPGKPYQTLADSIAQMEALGTSPLGETPKGLTGSLPNMPTETQLQQANVDKFNVGGTAAVRPAEEAFPGEKVMTMPERASQLFEPGKQVETGRLLGARNEAATTPRSTDVQVVQRIGDPARPLHAQFLRVREGKPVVHKITSTKIGEYDAGGRPPDMDMDTWMALDVYERNAIRLRDLPLINVPGRTPFRQQYPLSITRGFDESEILAGDVIDFGGTGVTGDARRYEVMPDGTLFRFTRKAPWSSSYYDVVNGELVLKSQKKLDGVPYRAENPYTGVKKIDVEVQATKPFTTEQQGIAQKLPGDDSGAMHIMSRGRAQAILEAQRQEGGAVSSKRKGISSKDYYEELREGEALGITDYNQIKRGRGQIEGRLRLANIAANFDLQKFRTAIRTDDLNLTMNLSTRDINIIKEWNRLSAMTPSMFERQKEAALMLLDYLPDNYVSGLNVSIRKAIPAESGGEKIAGLYDFSEAVGILTLSSDKASLHTWYHELFHHIHTWLPEEDLTSIASEWKQAILSLDTQEMIATIYQGYKQRIKTQEDLVALLATDVNLKREWDRIVSDAASQGKPPTDRQWKYLIGRMQETGKLPKNFLTVGTEDIGARSTQMLGNFPDKAALDRLIDAAYRFTSPGEFLAEVFADRAQTLILAKMVNADKAGANRNILNHIYDVLRDWMVAAYNYARRMGHKDTMMRVWAKITDDTYSPVDDEAVARMMATPLEDVNYGQGVNYTPEQQRVIDTAEGYEGAIDQAPMSAMREVRGATYGPGSSREGGKEITSMGSGPFAESETMASGGWNLIDSSTRKDILDTLQRRRNDWESAQRGMSEPEPIQGPGASLWEDPSRKIPEFPGMPEGMDDANVRALLREPEKFVAGQGGGAPSRGTASQMRAEGGGELPTSRLVQAYVDGEVVPRTPSGEPPAQLYRIMDKQQYDDAIKEGALKPAPGGDGRIFASGEPRLQFLEEPSRPAVLVAIDYSDADGWRAREASTGAGGAGEVSAATRNSIPASKLKLIAEGVNKAELLRGLQ